MKRQFPWFGIFLVLLGTTLLLGQLHILQFGWAKLLWIFCVIYGGGIVIRGFVAQRPGSIFWGTVLFLSSIFITLHQFEVIEYHALMMPVIGLFIFGFGFLMKFVYSPSRHWFSLLPSIIFLGLGCALILADLGYWYHYDVWNFVRIYWPVVIILLGITAFFKSRRSTNGKT